MAARTKEPELTQIHVPTAGLVKLVESAKDPKEPTAKLKLLMGGPDLKTK